MGASKNTAIENQEQEYYVDPEIKFFDCHYPDKRSEREILIDNLINRDIHMSYSKLKNLTSPVNFMNALLQPKKKNSGMNLGSLVDCLVLEEDKFEEKFTVVSVTPTTEKQEDFVQLVLDKMNLETFSEELLEEKFKEAVSEGFSRVKTDGLQKYIIAIYHGKQVVSQDEYNKAKKIAEHLKNAPDVADELCICEEFQKMIRFEYMGWEIVAILDTYSPSIFHDMKFVSNLNPDKFKWEIEKYDYELQIGVYSKGLKILGLTQNPRFKYILYDDKFNYSVPEIEVGYIDYCERKFENYMMRLNKMVDEKAFEKSFDFFKSKNVIYKPQWAAGFDYSIFLNDQEKDEL
ncbi:hypothetical protein CHRYSEOSP005_07160 [Chryseobacterium sp. Alg-005]|uniref:PD-(D/E)XK nuclease-like domain-containing protein n=1 Tax=Chryseobacterium sp. Alg-005 TaxID=3159516 RepID=UPI003555B969